MPSFFDLPLEKATSGLVADAITSYLETHHKKVDQQVLHEMEAMFRRCVLKQLMQPRENRTHYESNSLYSHPCARKARYTYDGASRPPVQARTLMKFILGDIVELCVLGIARLAGLDIGCNNMDLTVQGASDGKQVPVHPDGLLNTDGHLRNCEIKSCDSKTFDRWLAEGGPSDDWGYRTQATVEIQAWREAGYEVNETCFVAVSTGSRQGSIAEWIIPYQPELYDAWQARRTLRQQPELPPIPFQAVAEMAFHKGAKLPIGENLGMGRPVPRFNKNDVIYGWDYPTGRQIVPVACTYCDYRELDWPTAVMEMDGTRPVWVVPPPESKLFTGPERMDRGGGQ